MFGFIALSSKEPAKNKKLEYYEVVEYFHNSQVTAYELNIGTGALKMELADGTSVKYTVPNVTLFVDDVHESVVEFNKANPKKAIKNNYVSGASYDFWLQLIPIAITVVMLILLAVVFLKKMNGSISSENNRAMNFGKAKVKLGKDE